jgi:MFS family permease
MQQSVNLDPVPGRRVHAGSSFYYGWFVVSVSFLIVLLSMGVYGSFGNFLKPMSAEFGWDRTTVSLPAAVAILMNGLFQPFVGRLVDRFGPRRVITLNLLLLACSTAAIAATTGVWFLTVVYGVLFAFGLSGAGIVPNTNLVARWFVRHRGRAMGLVNAGGSVGQLLLIPTSMALLLWTDWRTTYLILAAILLVVGVPIALLILRNTPEALGLEPDGDGEPTAAAMGQGNHAQLAARGPLESDHWRGALRSTPLWLLSGGFFVCGFTVSLVSTHFVAFATDRGISPATAATALGLLGGFNVVGTLLAGTVSDRLGRKNPLALIYLVRAAAFAFLLSADAAWQLYVFAALAGLAWFSTVPLTVSLTAEIYGIRHMGTLVGLVFLSHQVGGALSSYLAGWLFDMSGSYTAVYLMGIALLLAAGLVSYGIQERRYSLKYLAAAKA